MTPAKHKILTQIVKSAPSNILNSMSNRKKFSKQIASECNLWEPNVISFVDEMKGLAFSSEEDRKIFLDFAEVGF